MRRPMTWLTFVVCLSAMAGMAHASERQFPKGLSIYCQERSCYDVLEIPEDAALADIKKAYRKLSLANHPDKSDKHDAPERFMVIAKAYEVLSNEKTRRAYDDFLAHPERHVWQHYGAYYQAYYAPKSDVRAVLAGIVLVISAVQYISVKHKQNMVKDIVLGRQETKNLVNKRIYELAGRQLNLKKSKDYEEYKMHEKTAQQEILDTTMLNDQNIGGGVNLKGILAVWIFLVPLITVKAIHYHCRWFVLFTVRGQDYGDEERRILTRAMVKKTFRGDMWLGYDEDRKQELVEMQLWLPGRQKAFAKEIREEMIQDYYKKRNRR